MPKTKAQAKNSDGLNDRQEVFCREYCVDLNAMQAAIRAGYSPKTAGSQACELLKRPNVKRRIATLKAERAQRTDITAEMVLAELARIGFSDIRKAFTPAGDLRLPKDIDDDTAAAVSGIEVIDVKKDVRVKKIKLWNKVAALEALGKHLGIIGDTVKHTGELKIKVVPAKFGDDDDDDGGADESTPG